MRRFSSRILFFSIFQILWCTALGFLWTNDRNELRNKVHAWGTALSSTVPRLLEEGSLVRIEALLRGDSTLPTSICGADGGLIASNVPDPDADPCAQGLRVSPLIFDSRQVGYFHIGSVSPFSRHPGVYALLGMIWIGTSLFYFWILRRRSDLRVMDGLLQFMRDSKAKDLPSEISDLVSEGSKLGELITAVVGYRNAIDLLRQSERELERATLTSEIARQLVHDIRSPIAALQVAVLHATGVDEQTRIQVRSAIERIKDISNGLLARSRIPESERVGGSLTGSPPQASIQAASKVDWLDGLLESMVSEVRLQYADHSDLSISVATVSGSRPVFANIDRASFQRVISNLVANSAEAMAFRGVVSLKIEVTGSEVRVLVEDTGCGISPELLDKVTLRGGTYGKKGGNGLGISHAKACVESWGGKLEIESALGVGTRVILVLPKAQTPAWFMPTLEVTEGEVWVILDDDSCIHELWRRRLSPSPVSLVHLHSTQALLEWYRSNFHLENIRYLVDYEFAGESETGLDVIDRLSIAQESILSTSRSGEEAVRSRAEKLGVSILPKEFASEVDIRSAGAVSGLRRTDDWIGPARAESLSAV